MTTFYVLPSRQLLGQRVGDLLSSLFPGTSTTVWDWPDLAEALSGLVAGRDDVCVVYREDLDDALSVKESLMRDFGADLNDDIIETHLGAGLNQVMHQRWSTETTRKAA